VRRIGDTGPPLVAVLRHEPTLGQRAGTPVDLTGATVLGIVRRWSDRAVIESAAATVITPGQGAVELPLATAISTEPGLHSVEFRVTGADQRTYPGPMDPWWLTMAAVLDGGVASVASDPTAPLFVADAGTATVTANGQMVFAGAGAAITVPASVSWLQVAWWDTQTPWAASTVPTLVQAGSTVDAGVAGALLASGGALVVITRAGTVLTAAGVGRAPIWAHDGATYAPDPDARLLVQATGDPTPTGLTDNDIVIQQNP
jgi:hypothetical protein